MKHVRFGGRKKFAIWEEEMMNLPERDRGFTDMVIKIMIASGNARNYEVKEQDGLVTVYFERKKTPVLRRLRNI